MRFVAASPISLRFAGAVGEFLGLALGASVNGFLANNLFVSENHGS
jgi:hypothetical protein